jgi:hypothetical protein
VNRCAKARGMTQSAILLVLLGICFGVNAWGQGACDSRQASCSPGQYVDPSGKEYSCHACQGNTVSNGCTRSCNACSPGTISNAAHTQCLPTCQASVSGATLSADSKNASGPPHVVSFLGHVTNPPSPTNNGKPWWPNGEANFKTFATQSTCELHWTWKPVSAIGLWVGTPGQAVQCGYNLSAHGQDVDNCTSGYKGFFTIHCAGNSCTF